MFCRLAAVPPVVLFAALVAADTANAHDFWLEPSALLVTPGAPLAVRLRVGERLEGDPVVRRTELLERFELIGRAGATPLFAPDGADPAGFGRAPQGGGYAVAVYVGKPTRLELDPDKFERYLESEGLEHVIVARVAQRESALPGREAFSRCAKALIATDRSDNGFDRSAGCLFEIVPVAPPPRDAGKRLVVRVLYRGKPAAGVRVALLHEGDGKEHGATRADEDGQVELMPDRPGRWLVKAVFMERAKRNSEVDWESYWASLLIEIPSRGTN